MGILVLSIILFLVGAYLLIRPGRQNTDAVVNGDLHGFSKLRRLSGKATGLLLIVVALFGFLSLSWVIVNDDESAHLKRVFFAPDLPVNHIIARDSEKGPQAEILTPGFKLRPFIRLLYDIEYLKVVDIPEGTYGFLVAKDGKALPDGEFIAPKWEGELSDMLDANTFLHSGGTRGPQLTVLPPGRYRLNRYLFDVKAFDALDVETGHVAVIRSNVSERQDCPNPISAHGGTPNADLANMVVPKGCAGVWEEPLPPGRYYLNNRAYVATIIPTRAVVWTYKGGYTHRGVNLSLKEDGTIYQEFTEETYQVPADAADRAINVRVEGWTFPVELRALVQVYPQNAARVVATIGTLSDVENRVITPTIRDVLRTIGGHPDRKVLDFVEKRDEIMSELEAIVVAEGLKAGVTISEVRMGEPAIPPELMVARLRKQLAGQMRETYAEEQKAQLERIEVMRKQATADQQPTLVKADIERQAAEYRKDQLRLEGEGEKLKLMEIAEGQEAQKNILGADRVFNLKVLSEILAVAASNPDIIKVPMVHVETGEGGSLEGAAAVLGASNFTKLMQKVKTPEE